LIRNVSECTIAWVYDREIKFVCLVWQCDLNLHIVSFQHNWVWGEQVYIDISASIGDNLLQNHPLVGYIVILKHADDAVVLELLGSELVGGSCGV
jgi:hypothetical protein